MEKFRMRKSLPKIWGFQKNSFLCLKIGIARILSLSCVQICIYISWWFSFLRPQCPSKDTRLAVLCGPKKYRYFRVTSHHQKLAFSYEECVIDCDTLTITMFMFDNHLCHSNIVMVRASQSMTQSSWEKVNRR